MTTPDKGIEKVFIPYKTLPAVSPGNSYYLRYRILYEDQSQYSAWSPKYKIDGRSVERLTSETEIVKPNTSSDGTYINCGWSIPPSLEGRNFDIFVRWSYSEDLEENMSEWFYDSTISAGNASINIPDSSLVITGASSLLGVTTYVVSHNYSVGDKITISNVTPSQYNATDVVITATTGTTISIAKSVSTSYISGGLAKRKARYVQVLAQVETFPKVVSENNGNVLFQTNIKTTRSVLDGGAP